ncbi:MAG: GFA family protein [Ectothiorhodospiraceae bacterium]|nr:GFA family protein [Ectothiorhodospiraceae bacterium]
MIGSCLCDSVEFSIEIEKLKIYQCHCSLCRKQTGTASSCGAIVKGEKFSWLTGSENISTWKMEEGFTSHFCSTCGSSVPNHFMGNDLYWIPAGLIQSEKIETIANIYVGDKLNWSNVDSHINQYLERPELEKLIELFTEEDNA